jgi:hypothetical protein
MPLPRRHDLVEPSCPHRGPQDSHTPWLNQPGSGHGVYFETDAGDGFRGPGFFDERGLEPQITLSLLTDTSGFQLTVQAFEVNRAGTATVLPVINTVKTTRLIS